MLDTDVDKSIQGLFFFPGELHQTNTSESRVVQFRDLSEHKKKCFDIVEYKMQIQ